MLRCGLLGRKLEHSYSPAIHEAFGGYSYELFEVEPDDLAAFMQRRDFHGINVTIPYKKDVIAFCEELSPAAKLIGSVNTILRRPDGSLFGDNTDAYGFLSQVRQSGIDVRGKKVIVLGSGGGSLAVIHALNEAQAAGIFVISRKGEDNYENIARHSDAQVIVNTTPVGMYPNTGKSLVDIAIFTRLEGVLDIIYNPARTRLLMDAEALGIPHLGGLAMLVGQARAASEIFCGRAVPVEQEKTVAAMLRKKMENLILIGMPGSGKSTVGRILAENTGKTYIDADSALEEAAGLTIPEIFEHEGEAGFRKRETEILRELGMRSGLVIATGGGCVVREENYEHLHQNATIVFLERDISLLARGGRPLSQGDLREMYERRLPLYHRFADLIIQNDAKASIIAKRIVEAIYENTGD